MVFIRKVARLEIVSLAGLRFTAGFSYEGILEKLENNGIGHGLLFPPRITEGFFRNSAVDIAIADRIAFQETIGYPNSRNKANDFYYGLYEIGKDFDLSQLTGIFSLDNGRLVERTNIRYF